MTTPASRTVAIFLFDDVEVLDFAGPFEVFAVTGQRQGPGFFKVLTVAEKPGPINARNGLIVQPHHTFDNFTVDNCPAADIVLIPGGYGTRPLIGNERVIQWIVEMAGRAELTLSVCTGALLLAKAGLLTGLEATTHHLALDLLCGLAPGTKVHRDRRVVDNGRIILSAGVAAGIDMALHVVARLHGEEQARETARHMEYPFPEAELRSVASRTSA